MAPYAIHYLKLSLFTLLMIATISGLACDEKEERALRETEVPQAIIESVRNLYPEAIVHEYSEELEDSLKAYEIVLGLSGQKITLIYSEHGSLMEQQELSSASELPQVIKEALRRDFANYFIEETERITRGDNLSYEVQLVVKAGDRSLEYELNYAQDGRLLRKSHKKRN